MRTNRRFLLFSLAAAAAALPASPAQACFCIDEPIENAIESADMIFRGRVVGVAPVDLGRPPRTWEERWETHYDITSFAVLDVLKGAPGETARVRHMSGRGLCGASYAPGDILLVRATAGQDGLLASHWCAMWEDADSRFTDSMRQRMR